MMKHDRNTQNGAVAIFVAAGAVALFGMLALAIDVGYMMTTQAELKNVADAGSMSASRELGRIYDVLGNVDRAKYTLTSADKARIIKAANAYTQQNEAAGVAITIADSDLEYGRWSSDTGVVVPGNTGVNAIRVMTRRNEQSNGRVDTIFGGILGKDSFAASAQSGAAMSGPSVVEAGVGNFPIGIARRWFDAKDSPCGKPNEIRLYPTGDLAGCAGWHTFDNWPASASSLSKILKDMKTGAFTSPKTIVGETNFVFTGGAIGSAFPEMKQLFNAKKGADGTYVVHVPVYDRNDCSNPNGWIKIVGYATARITDVIEAPEKQIVGRVECDIIPLAKGGGPDYGTLASAPTVIQ
jgi:hypothetical protein